MNEDIVIPLAGMLMIIVLAIGVPLVRAYVKQMEARPKQPGVPSELMSRLERMEQSLDAVAVEVERISEGQRFTTKLLSDSPRSEQKLPAKAEPISEQRG
jgi:hypothetical protein